MVTGTFQHGMTRLWDRRLKDPVQVKTNTFLSYKRGMVGLIYGVQCHFQQYFSYIVVVSFIDGGNRSTRRRPLTCRKSLTNFITYKREIPLCFQNNLIMLVLYKIQNIAKFGVETICLDKTNCGKLYWGKKLISKLNL